MSIMRLTSAWRGAGVESAGGGWGGVCVGWERRGRRGGCGERIGWGWRCLGEEGEARGGVGEAGEVEAQGAERAAWGGEACRWRGRVWAWGRQRRYPLCQAGTAGGAQRQPAPGLPCCSRLPVYLEGAGLCAGTELAVLGSGGGHSGRGFWNTAQGEGGGSGGGGKVGRVQGWGAGTRGSIAFEQERAGAAGRSRIRGRGLLGPAGACREWHGSMAGGRSGVLGWQIGCRGWAWRWVPRCSPCRAAQATRSSSQAALRGMAAGARAGGCLRCEQSMGETPKAQKSVN